MSAYNAKQLNLEWMNQLNRVKKNNTNVVD